jgi:hypothetical protein
MERLCKDGGTKQMRKNHIIALLFTLSVLVSCSETNYAIKKNRDSTNKEMSLLFQKNGNAFYLSYTYSYFSIVWSYNEDSVEIYRLHKGKIKQKQVFREKEIIQYAGLSLVDIETELYQKCALELDGDVFGFIIEDDGKRYNADFSIDINSFKRKEYESDFLNRVSNDIKYYKMWDFQPRQNDSARYNDRTN